MFQLLFCALSAFAADYIRVSIDPHALSIDESGVVTATVQQNDHAFDVVLPMSPQHVVVVRDLTAIAIAEHRNLLIETDQVSNSDVIVDWALKAEITD